MFSITEIPRIEWPRLRDLYSDQRADAENSFMVLSNFIEWTKNAKINEHESLKCYALDGDWQTDGTFILMHKYLGNIDVYFNTLSADLTRLTNALSCLRVPHVGDDDCGHLEYFSFDGYSERLRPALAAFLQKQERFQLNLMEYEYFCYRLDKNQVAKFRIDLPIGIKLDRLQLEHAEQINAAWPYRDCGSLQQIRNLISCNTNVGAYDEQGNMIAWCLRTHHGNIGLLEVTPEHQRRGLGAILVRCMAQLISDGGDEVMVHIAADNLASRGLFEKLGFQIVGKVHWTIIQL